MRDSFGPLDATSRSTRKNLRFSIMLFGIGTILGSVTGIFLFLQIIGGSATPSTPISAPTLSLEEFRSEQSLQVEPVATVQVAQPILTAMPTRERVLSAESTPAPTLISRALAVRPPQLFRIVPAVSQARFSVYETFPEGTAVGATNEIAGDIIVDFETPTNSQVGVIRINLRALRTDDPARDLSIRCCVLLTGRDKFEFGEFSPTDISPLPAQIEFGQTIPFKVTGDLTVRGVTHPVVFEVALRLLDETELRGLATAQIIRRDFGILNDAENGFDYHGVDEEVTLEFEFVARAVLSEDASNE